MSRYLAVPDDERSRSGPVPRFGGSRRTDPPLAWLPSLRWGAVLGQATTVLFAALVLGASLPLVPVSGILAVSAVANIVVLRFLSAGVPISTSLAGGLLTLDTLVLTALFFLCGGHSNPFTFLFLLDISIAAIALGAHWTWSLTILSVTCYTALCVWHLPIQDRWREALRADLPGPSDPISRVEFNAAWMGFSVAACLTAGLVLRLSRALDAKRAKIAAMRERSLRLDRLAAVTTLAAGAAHEMGSPLATIAVASAELARKLDAAGDGALRPLAADARLIRSEVDRCRAVLDRMAAKGGHVGAEELRPAAVHDLLLEVARTLPETCASRVDLAERSTATVTVPRRALVQMLRDFVRNGLDASSEGGRVTLAVEENGHVIRFTASDRGRGMPDDVLARVGEPFFTTKTTGQGLGLGLFSARTLCERLGWRLGLESRPGVGTTVTLDLPRTEA